MEFYSLLESLSVSIGIEQYGFTDGTDNHETVSIDETNGTDNLVSNSSCSLGDSSCETETQPVSTTDDEGEGPLSGIFDGQKKFLDEVSWFTGSKSLNANAAPIDEATYRATNRKCYESLGLFHTDKPIWCSCYESQSNWGDYSYNNWKSLTNGHSCEDDHPSEKYNYSDNAARNSVSSSSKTPEQKGNGIANLSHNEGDYITSFYDEQYGPACPRGYMPEYSLQTLLSSPYGSSRLEGYWAQAPSPGNNLNRNSPVSSDYMYLLHNENPEMTEMFAISSDSHLELMKDQNWCSSLMQVIPCHTNIGTLEYIIVEKITINNKNLTDAACTDRGSRSLQKLIKGLNKSNLAMPMTQALAYECYTTMLDHFGKRVIQQCFNYLDCSENEILYKRVIYHCLDLATHKVGCLSLNECIDTIRGPHGDTLLEVISDHSLYLSNNCYGTFVIQHVLQLQNPMLCDKICEHLEGNYARLSQAHSGSHLVERCLQSSNLGLAYLMDEIRTGTGMLKILAKHKYGNYVIQQALTISEGTNTEYYEYLLTNLLPLLPILEKNKYSKRLATLLQDVVRQR